MLKGSLELGMND